MNDEAKKVVQELEIWGVTATFEGGYIVVDFKTVDLTKLTKLFTHPRVSDNTKRVLEIAYDIQTGRDNYAPNPRYTYRI